MLRAGEALVALAPLFAAVLLWAVVYRRIPSRRAVLLITLAELVVAGAVIWQGTSEGWRRMNTTSQRNCRAAGSRMGTAAERPLPVLADPSVGRLFAALPDARLVGGCVRDGLLGLVSQDVDLATPLPPADVVAVLAAAGIRAVPTGLAHGTVTAMLDGRPFEITTLRRDIATDGRHADVAWTGDWREDAARRDFTINAMSLSPDGTLHDYFAGRDDLAQGRVRFVGDATSRVAEDYLRILRFFRFHARYGSGAPDSAAVAAITAGVGGMAQLSMERVWSELKRILAAPDPGPALALAATTGVLAAVVPEGAVVPDFSRLPPDPVLRMAAVLTGDPAAFAARMRLSLAEAARLAGLRGPPPGGDDAALRRQLADTLPDLLIGRSLLAGQPESVRDRLRAMPRPHFPLEGRHVVALGVAPGPAVGELLRRVRLWWLAGGCTADEAACRAELARLATAC